MLTVHKVGAADTAGYAAYLASQPPGPGTDRRGDYYLGPEGQPAEGPGQWRGQGAVALGLAGTVDREALQRVWAGQDPQTGDALVRHAHGTHVAAVDATFSAPKSVSVVWALGDPATRAALEAAHDRAVAVGLAHVERHAALVRRRVGGAIRHAPAQGLVIARFRHHTSRQSAAQQAAGATPDPQLHDHGVIANLALRPADAPARTGRWAAIDSRALYQIRAEAGAVYRAELAATLQRLGYRMDRSGRYVEVAGVSPAVRRAFSARAAEVEAAVAAFTARHGRAPTVAERRGLVVVSRSPKAGPAPDAFASWAARAATARADPRTWAPAGHPLPPMPWAAAVAQVVTELTDPASPHRLTAAAAVVDTRALRTAVAEAAQARVPGTAVDALQTAVEAAPALVALPQGRWTTRATLDAVQAVLAAVAARQGAASPTRPRGGRALPPAAVAAAIAQSPVPLDPEQAAAVQLACGPAGLVAVAAPAGAGKGQVLAAVARAHQAQRGAAPRGAPGRAVAVAVAGATAQRLGEQTGADVALTLEAFVHRTQAGTLALGPADVVLVDEAGVVETTRWAALLQAAGAARVVAAGDAAQLAPIGPGGLWAVLTSPAAPGAAPRVPTARLTTVYRADAPWARDAWAALRAGASAPALAAYAARDLVLVAPDRAAARAAAVARWDVDRQQLAARGLGVDQLLLTTDGTRTEVADLNARAQAARRAAGECAGDPVSIGAPDPDRPDTAGAVAHPGDLVVTTRPVYGVPAAADPGPRSWPRAPRRVENGETGTVLATDPGAGTLTVQLRDRPWIVGPEHRAVLQLGYAQHLYRAQGRTVTEVLVCGGGWQTDQASGYVGVTRARETSVIVTDTGSLGTPPGDTPAALAALAVRWATAHPPVAATTLAEQAAAAQAGLPARGPTPFLPGRPPAEPRAPDRGWATPDREGLKQDRERG
ncbi:MAG TPA: MobF family relaxase [Candidatus Dormibacteraeota bacterium]|nr:MobF family relaxase [Candidatus Dormibacteraeota bacterium]